MHRVRQNLPYLRDLGWLPYVLAVNPKYVEAPIDKILLKTIPEDIKIKYIPAFNPKITRRFGIGSLSIRSFLQFLWYGTKILKKEKFDLIFFSTTAFHVLPLGRIWKWLFKIPFIIDIQDPWRSDFYLDKPKSERPPKFWAAYQVDKFLEAFTLPKADGIIAVSKAYCDTLQTRYPSLLSRPCMELPFGAGELDFSILEKANIQQNIYPVDNSFINIVYVGRGGKDMNFALSIFFNSLKKGLKQNTALFKKIRVYFIGTSYAAAGKGEKTILPIAEKYGVDELVTEITNRVPYFTALKLLKDADLLFIPGSTDKSYTASKLYPYILSRKPIIAIFHKNSSVVNVIQSTNAGEVIIFNSQPENAEELSVKLTENFIKLLPLLPFIPNTMWSTFDEYTSKRMTCKQARFMNDIIT